jgi:hypothetical protein
VLASLAAAQLLLAAAQTAPIDPYLRPEITEAVTRASEAELDPKRGPGNALEILRARKRELPQDKALGLSIDLRIAATVLRQRFLASNEFPEPERWVQALSTFSRLDLRDPGVAVWIDRTLDKNPAAKRKLGKRSTWKLKSAILVRGSGLDRAELAETFGKALASVGAKLESVPAKEAPLVLTIAAEDAPPVEGKAAVKTTLSVQSIDHGKIVWEQSLYRVEAAQDPKVALKSGIEWLSRIGGRDLFFRWLGDNGLTLLKDPTPKPIGSGEHEERHGGIAPVGSAQSVPLKVKVPPPPSK